MSRVVHTETVELWGVGKPKAPVLIKSVRVTGAPVLVLLPPRRGAGGRPPPRRRRPGRAPRAPRVRPAPLRRRRRPRGPGGQSPPHPPRLARLGEGRAAGRGSRELLLAELQDGDKQTRSAASGGATAAAPLPSAPRRVSSPPPSRPRTARPWP